jgi:hypothetical protein
MFDTREHDVLSPGDDHAVSTSGYHELTITGLL